jgi:hypothetical protein
MTLVLLNYIRIKVMKLKLFARNFILNLKVFQIKSGQLYTSRKYIIREA